MLERGEGDRLKTLAEEIQGGKRLVMKDLEVQWVCSDGEMGRVLREGVERRHWRSYYKCEYILKKSTDIRIETLNCL